MNACLKTAGWLGAALPMLAAMIDVTPAQAQSSARELPAVVVDQPSRPPAARSRPAPRRQAASAASRRAAQRAQTPPDAAAAAGARAETATGPVRGYLANQSGTGTKTDTPLRETPQSITVVTADRVTDQGALTVQESLRYVPGVFADAYGPDSRGDYPRIRGQDPNIYLDGTRVVNTFTFNEWRPDPFTLERIEVLRGPASVLYGDTSTAGLLNLISKRPQAESFNEIGVQFGSFNRKQVQTGFDRQADQGRRVAVSLRRHIPRQRHPDRLRAGRSHRAGAVADLAADQQHQLDRARHLSEGQHRLLHRISAA